MNRLSLPTDRTDRLRRALILIAALLILATLSSPAAAARDVTVALTELRPTLFTDDQGRPAGFLVDLVNDMAAREDWNVIWVRGSLSESWARLASGEIDLLPGVAATPGREDRYDFSRESALSVWSQVYAVPRSGINTILDLDGKRVAVVRGDISGIEFRDYARKFGINVTYAESNTPADVFAAVTEGEADALVVFNMVGQEDAKAYGLSATPVMFNPTPLGFAVPEGKNRDLLEVIDRYIAEGKGNPSSTLGQAMEKWFGIKAGGIVPLWLWWVLGGIAGLTALFVVVSIILRREVSRKTAELARQNEALQAEVEHRTGAEEELVRKNEELRAAYEQLAATEEELRHNYQELRKSDTALMQARKKLNLLNTHTLQEIQNAIFSLAGYIQLTKSAGCSGEAQARLEKGEVILRSVEESLSFTKKYQNLGIGQPRWQNVRYTLINAISHLDFSNISRSVNLPDLEIYADPLLEDVFLTLMEYVRQREGAGHVSIRCRENPDSITIFVEDDGPGIPAAEKENIFSKEFTGKGKTSFFLAREILAITEISIRETGEPGHGARFEITVPGGEYRVRSMGDGETGPGKTAED